MVAFRLVQPLPSRARGWWLFWFFDPSDDAWMREALPDFGIVATVEKPLAVSLTDVKKARSLLGPAAANHRPSTAGFSAGCQSVRAMLRAGIGVDHVAVFDGTHASIPPEPWQIDIWKTRLSGPGKFLATCSSMGYTERIKKGMPNRATSTRHVLEAVIGRPLEIGVPYETEHVYVERFASGDMDGDAHMDQQNEIAPRLLRRVFGDHPEIIDEDEGDRPWENPALTIGERLCEWARAELGRGVVETKPNDHPRIREYFTAPFTRETTPNPNVESKLDLSRAENRKDLAWCAAAACFGLHSVMLAGDELPIEALRVSGTELERDAKRAKRWIPGDQPAPIGALAIFSRGPVGGWQRHVAVVESDDGHELTTIGGNEGDTWKRTVHHDRPLGFVPVDEPVGVA